MPSPTFSLLTGQSLDFHQLADYHASRTTSKLMLKAQIPRYTASERSLLISLLPQLSVNNLLIMDRGFPAIWVFTLLQQRGLPFLARMDGNQWPVVETFLQTDQAETVTSQSAIHLKRDI